MGIFTSKPSGVGRQCNCCGDKAFNNCRGRVSAVVAKIWRNMRTHGAQAGLMESLLLLLLVPLPLLLLLLEEEEESSTLALDELILLCQW